MQRQTQSREQALSLYLDVEVVDDSKQSMHINAAGYCNIHTHIMTDVSVCHVRENSWYANRNQTAVSAARTEEDKYIFRPNALWFYLPLFNTLILAYLQHSEVWEGRKGSHLLRCAFICVPMCIWMCDCEAVIGGFLLCRATWKKMLYFYAVVLLWMTIEYGTKYFLLNIWLVLE